MHTYSGWRRATPRPPVHVVKFSARGSCWSRCTGRRRTLSTPRQQAVEFGSAQRGGRGEEPNKGAPRRMSPPRRSRAPQYSPCRLHTRKHSLSLRHGGPGRRRGHDAWVRWGDGGPEGILHQVGVTLHCISLERATSRTLFWPREISVTERREPIVTTRTCTHKAVSSAKRTLRHQPVPAQSGVAVHGLKAPVCNGT